MNAEPVEQVEFRWQRGRDFGPIASSSASTTFIETCRSRFNTMAATPEGAVYGHRSVVYLDLPAHGLAAVIERRFDQDARPVGEGHSLEDGGRHAQVARALVGDRDVVDVDLALACERLGMVELGLNPGQVAPDEPLRPLTAGQLAAFTSAAQAYAPPDLPEGLAALIAAALREPARPISVLLPSAHLYEPGVPGAYLHGLRYTAGRLLEGTRMGWLPSFSTYEPSPGRATADLPHLVFRDLDAVGGSPPMATRGETRVWPYDAGRRAGAPADDYDHLAVSLVEAYERHGAADLDMILTSIVQRFPTLRVRLEAVAREFRLADPAPPPISATVPPSPGRTAERHLVPSQPVPPRPVPPAPRAAAAPPRPVPADPAAMSPHTAVEDLIELYAELDAQHGRRGFVETVELICAIAQHGVTLDARDAEPIIGRLEGGQWHIAALRDHYRERASERLAWLIAPLYEGRLGDPRLLERLYAQLARPDAPETWVHALTLFYARLNDSAATALGSELKVALVQRLRHIRRMESAGPGALQAQPPADRWQDDEHWQGSFLPVWASRSVSVPVWLLVLLPVIAIVGTALLVLSAGW